MADLILKVLILGSENVGKSHFKRLADRYFQTDYQPIVGVNVLSKSLSVDMGGKIVKTIISLWDISSKSRFGEIRKIFYKGGVGALFVFDLSKPSTWFHLIECYQEIVLKSHTIPFMVIGNLPQSNENKLDLKDVESWVQQRGGHFVQMNPENTSLLERTFINLISEIVNAI